MNIWKLGIESGVTGKSGTSNHIKHYLRIKFNNTCQECKWSVENVNTGVVPVEVHHIDGDYKNNKESNLQLLCPNCHSLTATYKSANKRTTRTHR
ncbi:hypothetical protein DRQ25_10640 [Candidatus Fermentibacteria bacterium]|nr:MAG: hypothetical protein DRQ25_10640 [Candidatus Fermentibacteria bacterium]